jgi:endonuclease/exonuclease/phosphatase family metal-dependent hydrolase
MIVFTFIFAGITLAGAYAQDVSPRESDILPFIALSLSFLLLGNVALAIYWILRLRFWFIVPLLAIAGNYQYIERIFRPFQSVPSDMQNANVLKVASFNADSFGKEWTSVVTKDYARYMEDKGVDILCFQEFGKGSESYPIDSICKAFGKWRYHVIPVSPQGKDCLQLAVFSRYPIKDNLLMTFKETANCAMWCDIIVDGKPIRLFNIHLQTTSVSSHMKEIKDMTQSMGLLSKAVYNISRLGYDMQSNYLLRGEQADYVKAKIKETPYPVVLCGDFNSLPSSYTYHTLLGNQLQDGFTTVGKGYMYTFRYLKRLLRIDYIMASLQFKPLEYYSPHNDFHSDHNPVVMAMKLIEK